MKQIHGYDIDELHKFATAFEREENAVSFADIRTTGDPFDMKLEMEFHFKGTGSELELLFKKYNATPSIEDKELFQDEEVDERLLFDSDAVVNVINTFLDKVMLLRGVAYAGYTYHQDQVGEETLFFHLA